MLYFVVEISGHYNLDTFVDFGLFKASDAAYNGLLALNAPPQTIAMGFVFLLTSKPRDKIWVGMCTLVFVQASCDWVLHQITFISNTDPILAGLVVVTIVHFAALILESPGLVRKFRD